MSRIDPTTSNLDLVIDRLVADELDPDDRRALLVQLEATPDGWRRCALAFLEDQAWRSALARPRIESWDQNAREVNLVPKPKRFAAKSARYVLAASLFAVFAGACFRAGVVSVERPAARDLVAVPPVVIPNPNPVPQPGQPLGWVTLVDPSEGEALPKRVPILANTESNERWLQDQPATIPDYLRAQWERRGYVVEERRRLVGLDLKDGRQVAIPVNEVALDFVGRQPL